MIDHADILQKIKQRPIALSIKQPACEWILADGKDFENRKWSTNFRGPVLIHAGKSIFPERRTEVESRGLKIGGIVGAAVIVDCVSESQSTWFRGPFGFKLENPMLLNFIPCRGALGFFVPNLDPNDLQLANVGHMHLHRN